MSVTPTKQSTGAERILSPDGTPDAKRPRPSPVGSPGTLTDPSALTDILRTRVSERFRSPAAQLPTTPKRGTTSLGDEEGAADLDRTDNNGIPLRKSMTPVKSPSPAQPPSQSSAPAAAATAAPTAPIPTPGPTPVSTDDAGPPDFRVDLGSSVHQAIAELIYPTPGPAPFVGASPYDQPPPVPSVDDVRQKLLQRLQSSRPAPTHLVEPPIEHRSTGTEHWRHFTDQYRRFYAKQTQKEIDEYRATLTAAEQVVTGGGEEGEESNQQKKPRQQKPKQQTAAATGGAAGAAAHPQAQEQGEEQEEQDDGDAAPAAAAADTPVFKRIAVK
eukprot:TRINITY_DN2263_c0_g1_i1.p1 TRINITY_DN2263_c0_g1~~TRINITY_DN2263_c0_g1_i1.p1  ORF type:complete len:329 (+),score=59.97 TRINITY_DN2263_c0_g1_i1:35-1021(+)